MRTDESITPGGKNPLDRLFALEKAPTFSHSGHERNHLFLNRGGKQFADISEVSGLDDPADGRSFGLLDYDRDGWQDIVVVNANNPLVRLYRNRIGEDEEARENGNHIAVRFVGGNHSAEPAQDLACRDGYGARVELTAGDLQILREHRSGEGLASQNSTTVLIGIGANRRSETFTVIWPSGTRHSANNIPAGSLVTAYEVPGESPSGEPFVISDYASEGIAFTATTTPGATVQVPIHSRVSQTPPAQLAMYTTMATWCPKCKGELPQLATLRSAFAESELEMHGVPIDPEDDAAKLSRYETEFGPAYELEADLDRGQIQSVEELLKSLTRLPEVLPATIVTDSNGAVLLAQAGVPSISELKKLLVQTQP